MIPIIQAGVAAAQNTDIGKAIREGIDKFSEGMPVLMNALDELKAVHPFIGGEFILADLESSGAPGEETETVGQ